jgi:hypothetical protein
MTGTLTSGRTGAVAGRAVLVPLAAREARRFVLNPVFGLGVVLTMWIAWTPGSGATTEIDNVNGYPAVFLGGFGLMAAYWLTRSTRASEPVAGVAPTARLTRTAALCWVAIVPFCCGVVALFGFLRSYPAGGAVYGAFSPSARIAILAGQIVIPAFGGPLLGVALGRWVRFPGAAFVLFLVIFGWVELVTILTFWHPDSVPVAVLRLFSPFAFFTVQADSGGVTAWPGSPWYFIGWQLALCAIAVLVALLRGAQGPVRARIGYALVIAGVGAMILLLLAGTGGFSYAVTV